MPNFKKDIAESPQDNRLHHLVYGVALLYVVIRLSGAPAASKYTDIETIPRPTCRTVYKMR